MTNNLAKDFFVEKAPDEQELSFVLLDNRSYTICLKYCFLDFPRL